jgi:GNAT superfamily N-acetyltransferase
MGLPGYNVRNAMDRDFPDIQSVQRAAAARFREVDMPEVADRPVLGTDLLARFCAEGVLLVATFERRVVAFVACAPLDDALHIAEIDVVPTHAGHRLGALLLDHVDAVAAARHIGRLTLATYRNVPWNAPYYARLGFRECTLTVLGSQHGHVWRQQGESGLDLSKRLFMQRQTRHLPSPGVEVG